MPDDKPTAELLEHTTKIVAAHVANNAMPAADLPGLIATVHETLAKLGTEEAAAKPKPAVPISVTIMRSMMRIGVSGVGLRDRIEVEALSERPKRGEGEMRSKQ